MKTHSTRWSNVWGEVRKVDDTGHDFILWAGHHYVRKRVSNEELERNPDLYGRIFEELIDKVRLSMHKGGWFG